MFEAAQIHFLVFVSDVFVAFVIVVAYKLPIS